MPSRSRLASHLGLAALCALLVLVAAPLAAQSAPSAGDAAPSAEHVATPGASAVTITWNRADGSFGAPDAEQARALAAELAKRLTAARYPGGGEVLAAPGVIEKSKVKGFTRIRVPASKLSAAVVRYNADGELAPVCAASVDQAAEMLGEGAPAPAPRAELEVK